MMLGRNLLKFVVTILLLAVHAHGQIYTYQNLNHKNGLILNSVSPLLQASDGGIIMGTLGAGLVEYDGNGFRELAAPGQDLDHHVRDILIEDHKTLFTSQYKGVFSLTSSGKIQKVYSLRKPSEYWNLFRVNGDLIIVHSQGIIRYANGVGTKLLDIPKQFGELHVWQTIEVPEGTILLSDHDHYIIDNATRSLNRLNDFFKVPEGTFNNSRYGYYAGGCLDLFSSDLQKIVCLERANKTGEYNLKFETSSGLPDQHPAVAATTYNKMKDCFTVILENGQIYEGRKSHFHPIPLNYSEGISKINKIIADKHGDYWVSTDINGIFKISLEPFTRLYFHPEFESSQIRFTFKTKRGKLFFSILGGKTYYGDLFSGTLKSFDKSILSACYHNGLLYCGAKDGLYVFDEQTETFSELSFPSSVKGQAVQMLASDGRHLWIGAGGIGLIKVNFKGHNIIHFTPEPNVYPSYCYTAQLSFDRNFLFVGSNSGIYRFGTESNSVKRLKTDELGSYCGLSEKDVFGTNWFTLEKGIVGITKRGEMIKLTDNTLFPSFLFYTLNSDNYGNLILGTNRGLNVLRVNEEGKVLSQATYEGKTGFDGYETHMRSSFQNEHEIFMGTAEGLFYVNPEALQNIKNPFPPCIQLINDGDANSSGSFRFSVVSKNPKSKILYYTYRIKEVNEKWSELSSTNNFIVNGLDNGKYTLEVRATYDGYAYSPVQTFRFEVNMPIYRSNWFIVAIIILIIGLNVYFLTRSKNLYPGQLFYSEEFFIIQKLAPILILFGAISNSFAHLIAPMIAGSEFEGNAPLAISVGMVILSIYFLSLNNKNNGNIIALKRNLIVAFIVIMCHNIYGIYVSSLHPFYALAVIIVGSIAPFIFERIQSILVYAVCFIVINGAIILSTDGLNYNKYLYMVAVFISAFLVVLMTYIRHDSIHKLVFISSVINKGNIPAIAFDQSGKIIYISRNISKFIPASQNDLLNKPISLLNQFIPQGEIQHGIDLTKEFRDGTNYIVPMLKTPEEVIWIEWSCKEFSSDVKVILGQNITTRMELQNTYEVLVQNAEDFIYQVDVNGIFKFFNNRFFDRLHYRMEEIIGLDSTQLVVPEYRETVRHFYRNHFLEKKKISYLEFPILKADGGIVWLGQYVTSLYQASNKDHVTGFLALGRDITERRHQDQVIAAQSEDIRSSINYARRIQLNLLPSAEVLNEYFDETFIFFQPKDIVSGDFYWCKHFDEYTVLAVADCTGHGVPGAFMSLLGINLLNSIVQDKQLSNPGRILDELDVRLRQMLPRYNDDVHLNDGMEITLCIFDNHTSDMTYACAGSKILVHNGNNFNLYKGDSKHIGDERPSGFNGYVTHHTTIETNSTVYLFTDGFQDQFGGRQDKKYSFRRLLELFEENIRLPLSAQADMIAAEFENWKADEEQTDDVTILGIRKKS